MLEKWIGERNKNRHQSNLNTHNATNRMYSNGTKRESERERVGEQKSVI